jgi:hypothetical protein
LLRKNNLKKKKKKNRKKEKKCVVWSGARGKEPGATHTHKEKKEKKNGSEED